MAGLGLGLGISSGTVSSGDAVTPTPGRTTNFGRLISQDDDFILTQDGDDLRFNTSILADVIESIIAAIYLDSNIIECKKFINDKILKNILHLTKSSKHPKSFLQEYSIKYFNSMPKYNLVKKIGPDHSPNFIVNVSIKDKFQTLAEGRNIQLAEENAAKKLISIIETNEHK